MLIKKENVKITNINNEQKIVSKELSNWLRNRWYINNNNSHYYKIVSCISDCNYIIMSMYIDDGYCVFNIDEYNKILDVCVSSAPDVFSLMPKDFGFEIKI